jgi:hypothetical protein
LRELTGIPLESIEVARVEAPFPFNLNPLAIHELPWFSAGTPAKRPLYLYNDELILFVRYSYFGSLHEIMYMKCRDKSQVERLCTPEEENKFRLVTDSVEYGLSSSSLAQPRREIGIQINLNSNKPGDST